MFKNIIAYTKELFSSSKTKKEPEHYVKTPRIIGRDEHGIDRRLVSLEAMRTVRNLQRAGYEAYVVGGAVRDLKSVPSSSVSALGLCTSCLAGKKSSAQHFAH